ncbi:MAG TPA: bifunctional YncE family protein/alkaline phosphatase family protein [Gemmatimonadales bacterium]|jgi:6-phosphogluconolactonase (cycloisomerase 2 family)|nr:bifunctional YncE family protein/alkaline phosphatase family protein [Gemmatimonadales bacterium]
MLATPEGNRIVLLLNGYREQGIQIVEPGTGRVTQTLSQPAAFIGAGFDHAGRTLYASGGNQDVVYRYGWSRGSAAPADSLILAPKAPRRNGTRYPAGLALSPDDRLLYVAENLADTLAVIELASGQVVQRLPAGRYPYAVVSAADGTVYVSAWGGYEVIVYRPNAGRLSAAGSIRVGRHPSALLLNRNGSRLYVASASTDRVSIVDTRARRVVAELGDSVPGGTGEGSTPNALALSADEQRLYVAEADNNAVAIFEVVQDGGRLLGRIPVGWYPAAVLVRGDTLLVANAKGRGTAANQADSIGPVRPSREGYTLSQLSGTLSLVAPARVDSATLAQLSARVARANGWDRTGGRSSYPPFEHVIYLVKENRTYDQVFGDLPQGDGDTSLVFFPRAVSPNHHALAERFGLFDRFFVNAEVSADGHNWSMAAYATDYTQKTLQQNYSGRGRSYDFQGENRGVRPAEGEDAAEPAEGYLWDLARKRGISFRNFGEFVAEREGATEKQYGGLKPFLEAHTEPAFPGFDMSVSDQRRADIWLAALARWERDGEMPALQILYLPNDHTMGGRAGELTPRAYVADNDLALGRVIEALSKSRFWRNTIVFVLEDDAQNGPDHVDSHRSPFLVISAWNRPRVWHRFTNTTDVLATIEEILTLEHLSQFDKFGRPLRGIYAEVPDLTPYAALRPQVPLTERNPVAGSGAEASAALDFRLQDRADDDAFNRALWLAVKGPSRPYPGATVMTPATSMGRRIP